MKMELKNLKEKSIIFFIGLFTAVLLLEIGLRIVGIIHLKSAVSEQELLTTGENSHYTILCLGDSFTYGVGASQEKSYPRQLENLLNSRAKGKIIRVVNRGIGGSNTTLVLSELQDNIAVVKPDLVILWAGISNYWDYTGFYEYLQGKTLFSLMGDNFCRMRVYKLIKILFHDLKNKVNRGLFNKAGENNNDTQVLDLRYSGYPDGVIGKVWNYLSEGKCSEAINSFKKGIKLNPEESSNYVGMGWIYKEREPGDKEEAIRWFKKGIKANSYDSRNYTGIADVYRLQRKYTEALKWFKKAIEINPRHLLNYRGIAEATIETKRYEEVIEFLEETGNPSIAKSYIEIFKREKINEQITNWIKFDIKKIIKICQDKKIKIILLNYPDVIGRGKINQAIKEIAKEYFLPFVGNHQKFKELWNAGEKQENFYSLGHCNAKGYEIVAKGIYDEIMGEKMLDEDAGN